MINPASRLLLRHNGVFFSLILPPKLIVQLRTEKVISKEVQSSVTKSGNLLVGEALRAVCVTVAEDHNKLRVLADVLLKFDDTAAIGNEILEEYGKYYIKSPKI